MSELSAMLRVVNLIDGLEVGRDLLPQQWKRYVVAPAVIVTALLCPDLAQRTAFWLGEQFSQRYMEIMTNTVIPVVAFSRDEQYQP